MAFLKRSLRILFARAEAIFDWSFGQRNNPLSNLGSLGWFFFWIVAGSGIYLYLFFDTGIVDAYASVEYITHDQWWAAGIMRSLHRYASDALVIVVFLHILREFSLDRLRGKRFFAWFTGVPLLWFIYICGITGVFMHIFAPLFMLLLMWVHIQRHARARVNPPRALAIGTVVTLLVLSLVYPAVSQDPANLDVVPTSVNLDWYYLAVYPLLDVIPGGKLWLVLVVGSIVLSLMPWLPPAKKIWTPVVSLQNCNGCGRCFDDCPFSAISMEPRSDGASFALEAVVDTNHCVSCGICTGSCPTATPFRRTSAIVPGIELPDNTIADLREKTMAAAQNFGDEARIIVYACDHSGTEKLRENGTQVITMPCVGMLPPSFIDFALSRDFADGVMLAGCAEGDCYYRLGDDWTNQRIDGKRDPYLRKRVDRDRLETSWLPAGSSRRRERDLQDFKTWLEGLPPKEPKRRRDRD
jgi:coenzyme F420-reducing hydrogenase delta subunit/Pyruvate/2-oxoacid:ferredoxin oxidoreductase delta subunit